MYPHPIDQLAVHHQTRLVRQSEASEDRLARSLANRTFRRNRVRRSP